MLHRYMKISDESGGFTFIEVIITMLIFSIVSIPVFTVFSRIIHVTEKIKTANRYTREIISLDDFLNNAVSEIQFPFWMALKKDTPYMNGKNHIEVPYWKGKRNSALILDCKDGVLSVISPDETRIFKGWEAFISQPLRDKEGRITGIVLILKKVGTGEVRFLCVFGAIGHGVFTGAEK